MKKIIGIGKIAIIAIVINLLFVNTCMAISYSDLEKENWAFKYIDLLSTRLVINGYPDGTFRPDQHVKVGEFIKLIVNSESYCSDYKEPGNGEHWAYQYAIKLKNIAYFNKFQEYDDYDTLERNITREEMAYFCGITLYAYHNELTNYKEGEKTPLQDMQDASEISSDLETYVKFCIKYGIINGYPDGTFKPKGELTRAEAAKVIYVLSALI